MYPRAVRARALPPYRIEVDFSDGTRGVVDLEASLFGPMFEPLKDPKLFAEVGVDEFGVVCWPNGADLAPDALFRALRGSAGVTP